MTWRTESLRVTAFTSSPPGLESQTWWTTLVGEEPERVSRPGGFLLDTGRFGDNRLSLMVQLGRIDWSVGANPERLQEGIPNIGTFPESKSVFSDLVLRWLEASPPLARLAFGAVLHLPVKDVAEGNRTLMNCLPAAKTADLEGTSDFNFSINRPRPSTLGIEALIINRISRWSLQAYQSLQIAIPVVQTASPQTSVASLGFHVRLELDISTNADFPGTLAKNRLSDILLELIESGAEISRKGDLK